MAWQIAWILTVALACGAPASAAALCEHGPEQTDQRAGKPGDRSQDKDHHDPPARDDHRPWKFWQGDSKATLGITNQQSAEIEQIFQSTLPTLEASKDRIDKLEATLSRTIKENTADVATVAQQIDRLESARAEVYKARTLMLYRMRGLLTADQRAKLQAMWEAGRPKNQNQPGRR